MSFSVCFYSPSKTSRMLSPLLCYDNPILMKLDFHPISVAIPMVFLPSKASLCPLLLLCFAWIFYTSRSLRIGSTQATFKFNLSLDKFKVTICSFSPYERLIVGVQGLLSKLSSAHPDSLNGERKH